ncbi:unnamed protein product [Gemmata massiliana]|uniref:Uncharacterized protein n=1 Tax=Gemmata massiliana TaxID=1210884 RepID=A0A6P2CRM5_9BACT|nr:hypothetical protein [Gemmata massiliana]VTR90986.1 unnamed protein product [Gemmata massiliana]
MAEKPTPPEGTPVELKFSYRAAGPTVYQDAEVLLKSHLLCSDALKKRIRRVAKSLLDETDELNRLSREFEANREGTVAQLSLLSPSELVDLARGLTEIVLSNKTHQEKVRKVSTCYVGMAEFNRPAVDDIRRQLGLDPLPPDGM